MSSPHSLSFLVPTAGRIELEVALASIAPQLESDDEVIVIGDTLGDPLRGSQAITRSFGPQFRWLEYCGEAHDWGHGQLNFGLANARGAYLHCSDDDDMWLPGAADAMRRAIDQTPGRPFLFRFQSQHYYTFWDMYGLLAQDHVGGHCLVTPNIPGKIGFWSARYQGDFDYVLSTVTLHGGVEAVVWRDEIVVQARPNIEMRRRVLEASGRVVSV